jgi:hypothetical protein
MKAHLMHRQRDFDLSQSLPSNKESLTQDLELSTLFNAMARGDKFLLQVAQQAVLSGLQDEPEVDTILYRQAVLEDCLRYYPIVKSIYDIAGQAFENKNRGWLGVFGTLPSSILYSAVELLQMLVGVLGKLERVADEHGDEFESEGFRTFFAMLKSELADDYFAAVKRHLEELKFHRGVLVSAELGKGNGGTRFVLCHAAAQKKSGWIDQVFGRKPPGYTYHLHPRDDAGARALGDLRSRGINSVANAAAQSADHVLSFFTMLRTELAFYLGCVNLHGELLNRRVPVCFPVPTPPGTRRHAVVGLRDACLALRLEQGVVGNDFGADGKNLVVITGANQGGKSTLLRAVGLAQLMMQSGMFVAAESFSADVCRSLFTHYKREEDVTMKSGKFDEELARMSEIVKALTPDSIVLFNESFAATNEREGSEIARQIVRALLEKRVKVFFVTHLYEFARGLWEEKKDDALFLRAERQDDGTRTFKVLPGEPLQTSFGGDLYHDIFESAALGGK